MPFWDAPAVHGDGSGRRRAATPFDAFRAIVSTVGGVRLRSRRGWPMERLLRELAELPPALVLDGGLVGNGGGLKTFPRVCRRALHRDATVPVTFVLFDVLRVDGDDVRWRPYRDRRAVPYGLADRPASTTLPGFDDGEAL